jgi:hypothetical protein
MLLHGTLIGQWEGTSLITAFLKHRYDLVDRGELHQPT